MANSSAFEVLSVILPSVLLVFICTTFTTIFHSKLENAVWRYICDFCVIVIPQILNITVLTQIMPEILCIYIFIVLSVITLAYMNKEKSKYTQLVSQEGKNKNFITNVRATINLITVIAILAVDFKIFPQQFKKQLKYGYSLMDVGVGLFVFANAIVAPEIKLHKHTFKKSVIDTIPLIILGVGRYITTTLTEYNVSVTEYGKHWNFFITLAVTRIISSLLLNFVPLKFSGLCGIVLLIIHEIFLQLGLAEYVLSGAKRDNFFSANREGITSTLGFVALYFLSVAMGIWLNLKESKLSSKISLFLKCSFITVILLPLTFVLENKFGLSRRLANSAYCVWILFIGIFMTSLFYIVEMSQEFLYKKCNFQTYLSVPFLLDAINYNGLIFFLLANILTGIINMSCDTLLVSPLNSIVILILYMNVTCIVAIILYMKAINIKFIISYLTKPKKKLYNI